MTIETIEHAVLGMRTQFTSDCEDVLAVVEDSFRGWDCLPARDDEPIGPLRVTIRLIDGDEGTAVRAAVRHHCPDERLIVQSVGSEGVSDPSRREAFANVTRTLVADTSQFREAVVEALTFALLSHFDRHPIHAAAIALDGHAVLLAGPSGAGKSTLAHLAHTNGIAVLGDDHVWIQLEPTLRVWGSPGRVRLVSNERTLERGGKAVLRLESARRNPECYVANDATVCLLTRGDVAALERVDRATIVDALTADADPGFDRFPVRHGAVVDALARNGGWRLTLSPHATDALPFLAAMLGSR